ncbi:putative inner membrane protein [Pseudomonas syringae pv. maculicola]|uniref:Putative inner membrane protein n=1 Tax=Pseudomonas syringae pv. maculicola TaxID=59511 RepID=A0A0N0X204_PSEYM|nr:Uncharacterized protein AC503_0226 [Pseudomonas syringae pv. maculicola]KPC20079.1 Uncharacterized protein AC506_1174 [Pseudomonas syringae pv. maculicola str. M6]KPX70157.1 putative inner membrane protein [Pseudomonas syringae pv. maculicola]RMM73286.1 putative inner membrane protein [Pseudomonas syringae pv. maculicola]RMV39847.1 putative inner membrane protein [Pseudomonas syringae pv. maculicola]
MERSGELFGLVEETPATEQPEPTPKAKGKPAAKRPAKSENDLMPGGFRLTPEGMLYAGDDDEARPVCSPLEILARTRRRVPTLGALLSWLWRGGT